MSKVTLPIYFDYNASTPVHKDVLQAMLPYFSDDFGNASSKHSFGWRSDQAVENAREMIASLLNVEKGEIYFTSGATESINCAVQGIWESYKDFRPHFITVTTEHSAMLEAFRKIDSQGAEVDFLKVDKDGRVSVDEIEHKIIEGRTCMISVMLANNETGVIQDIKGISKIARLKGALMMSDTTQAIGKIDVDIQDLGIDVACVSGHKIYGPKGVGVLYLRRKQPRVHLTPIIVGGGHEKGIRAGSLNVPGIVGLGKACELVYDELKQREKHFLILRNCLLVRLKGHKEIILLGSKCKLSNTLFLSLGNRKASDFIKQNQSKLALSLGSACDSAHKEGSYVLKEMGYAKEEIKSSIRLSLGIYNTLDEVEFLADRIIDFYS